MSSIREERITFPKGAIQDGLLRRFYDIHSGALEVYLVLGAYASEEVALAKVPISKIRALTGFGFQKILDILDALKDYDFINSPMRELPLEERRGKAYIYEIKELL